MNGKNSELSPYVVKYLRYIEDVQTGRQVAGSLIIDAANRAVRDLERQDSKDFPYIFDVSKAHRACAFIEKLPHIKGVWANKGQRISLEDWQCFLICSIFGWVFSRDVDIGGAVIEAGNRRFRSAYVEVARKNAKSTIAAAIGLYMTVADGEQGAECYSAATTRKQAAIVWKVAKQMVQKSPALRDKFHVEVTAHTISTIRTAGVFEALHSQGETLDGLNVHFASVDELHAHKTREVFDVLETAMGSRSQPLQFNITTAGFNRAGVCFEVRGYAVKVLSGVIEDDQFFALVYTLDEGDDPFLEDNWIKANPNYGISVSPLDMRALARKAKETPSAQNNFLTKRLNIWCNAETAWMSMQKWDACADHAMKESDFINDPCVIGVDIASKIDLTAAVRLYLRWDNAGQLHLYCFPTFWLPEETIKEDRRNSQYFGWHRRGLLRSTPGNVIDMDEIESRMSEWYDTRTDCREIAYDPAHNATQWASHLGEDGLPMVEVRPTVLNFSEPMKWLEALVRDGRFHHDGNEIMTWCISNVVVKWDLKDNIYPRKEREENKIDGAVALISAVNRAIAHDEGQESNRGLVII